MEPLVMIDQNKSCPKKNTRNRVEWLAGLLLLAITSATSHQGPISVEGYSHISAHRFRYTTSQLPCSRGENFENQDFSLSTSPSPHIALITELDACDSMPRVEETLRAIECAVSTGRVSLVSVRVAKQDHEDTLNDDHEARVVELTTRLVALSERYSSFRVVVSSDWMWAAQAAKAHGIHFKERHCHLIPEIRKQFASSPLLVGTSTHSIQSAKDAWSLYRPDYLFVGTCYATQSHPGKVDLEGPELPGRVCQELQGEDRPIVFAIGGIDVNNCHEPVSKFGADGVSIIRAILQSPDPAATTEKIYQSML